MTNNTISTWLSTDEDKRVRGGENEDADEEKGKENRVRERERRREKVRRCVTCVFFSAKVPLFCASKRGQNASTLIELLISSVEI